MVAYPSLRPRSHTRHQQPGRSGPGKTWTCRILVDLDLVTTRGTRNWGSPGHAALLERGGLASVAALQDVFERRWGSGGGVRRVVRSQRAAVEGRGR